MSGFDDPGNPRSQKRDGGTRESWGTDRSGSDSCRDGLGFCGAEQVSENGQRDLPAVRENSSTIVHAEA